MIPMFKALPIRHDGYMKDVLESGWLGEAKMVTHFASNLEHRFRHNWVVPVNSCTSAMILALERALTRKCGVDFASQFASVVTSPFSMVATCSAIATVGARPVFCDVDPSTLCMDVYSALDMIDSAHAKVVLVTLVGGMLPVGFGYLLDECKDRGVLVILDAAHAYGTTCYDEHISHFGDYCCFSFQAIKHLTCGDGGAITVNTKEADEEHQKLMDKKWFGISRKLPSGMSRLEHQMTADITSIGYKFHMNDIAAAVGLESMVNVDDRVHSSQSLARLYTARLSNAAGLDVLTVPSDTHPGWWIYGFLIKDRSNFITHLEENGIAATPMWRPIHEYSSFESCRRATMPGMERVKKEAVFIPNGWWVSEIEAEDIIGVILDWCCND